MAPAGTLGHGGDGVERLTATQRRVLLAALEVLAGLALVVAYILVVTRGAL